MSYYSSGDGMAHADASFARAQAEYDNATPREPEFHAEPRVLRVVVYLTYDEQGLEYPEEAIDYVQSTYTAERDIQRVLSRTFNGQGLEYTPAKVEVVDAEYMGIEEAREG